MSINKRYTNNTDRRNVNNRTFTNHNDRGGGKANTSPTRPTFMTSQRTRVAVPYGLGQKNRQGPRYQIVPEEDFVDDDPYDKSWDDVKKDGVIAATEEGEDQRSEMSEEPEENSHHFDRLFMTEEEMLEQSAAELQATIEELEKRYEAIEDEGNEWKTRYETQQEMNQQLERQIILLQNKVEEGRLSVREANKSPRDNKSIDGLADASPKMIKALEREKHLLASQLRDLEWRMDQESKAYHKANDERKQYVLEINATRSTIAEMKTRQKLPMFADQEGGNTARTYRDPTGNIPNDQRIIDPKRGPIKKTAGVKNLPSLEPEY